MEGEEIKLYCESNAPNKYKISWFKNNILESKFTESEIYIRNVTLEDAGNYKCLITTNIDFSEATIAIKVLKTTRLKETKTEEITATTGTNHSLSCEASVDPELRKNLQLLWKKNDFHFDKNHIINKVKLIIK